MMLTRGNFCNSRSGLFKSESLKSGAAHISQIMLMRST